VIPIRDTIPRRYAPVVTWALIAVNTAVFFYELLLDPKTLERLFYLYGMIPARLAHPTWTAGDFTPFLTSMFLHGGWAHVIGNMWALWIFGDNVEDRMGKRRFVLFYLLAGVVAGLTHWITNPDSTIPAVGASGAIAGVLGAYFILYPKARIVVLLPVFWPFFFEMPAVAYLFFWFLSQIFGATLSGLSPGSVGGVAWSAHVGGFVAGVVLHRWFLSSRRRPPSGVTETRVESRAPGADEQLECGTNPQDTISAIGVP
jgi:membrane associated rhomboid family serine protease